MAIKIFAVVFTVISLSACRELPITYNGTELVGTVGGGCPSDTLRQAALDGISSDIREMVAPLFKPGWALTPQLPATSCQEIFTAHPDYPSGSYWVTSSSGTAVQVYCDMDRQSCCDGLTGGWTRIAYLNMTDPSHVCPPRWREITTPKRLCGRRNNVAACRSVRYPSHGIPYSRVCGRAVAYQYCTPDAFNTDNSDINGHYIDGLSVTHGNPRQHVWSFVAGVREGADAHHNCPCSSADFSFDFLIPSFVGDDYFCDTASSTDITPGISCRLYVNDPLWDGAGCGVENTCCEERNPPWFCRTLAQPTADDLEVRLCGNEHLSNEDTPVELIEIYVI